MGSKDINENSLAVSFIMWSFLIATLVSMLFMMVDFTILDSFEEARSLSEGISIGFRISFSYFFPAVVTSVLTLLIQCILMDDYDSIGINNSKTPHVILLLITYLVFYFIYLNYYEKVIAGVLYLVLTLIFVVFILFKWINNRTVVYKKEESWNFPNGRE